jgi:hypothetical protein
MRPTLTLVSTLATLATLAAACGAPADDNFTDDFEVVDGKADGVTLPKPGNTADRLYFDTPAGATLTDDAPLKYWVFTARAHHTFSLDVRAVDPNSDEADTLPSAGVGFKLYRLARSNHYYWRLVATADSVAGLAHVDYKGASSRWYMLEVGAGQFPTQIEATLGCAGGDHTVCALAPQPGDACSATVRCDSGLFCSFDKSCGGVGACAIQPTICPRLGVACFPVCGCDGKTYCAGCDVASHGVSVAHMGTCDCDLNQYEDAAGVSPSGTYQYINPDNNDHYTYSFMGKAGFTSLREPGCLFATPFACKIAVRQRHGLYSVNGDDTVTLTYDEGDTAMLITQTNCAGTDRLGGTDYGTALLYLEHAN